MSTDSHDTCLQDTEELSYFETPYSLLDTVSPGYRKAFGLNLASQLEKLSQA